MEVSYCITCGNRLWQLKQTLPKNVKYLIPGKVELCILAHNPPTLGIGYLGRIGVYRSLFDKVGGYRDIGRRDDGDFIGRCLNTGARLVKLRCSVPPIDNNP